MQHSAAQSAAFFCDIQKSAEDFKSVKYLNPNETHNRRYIMFTVTVHYPSFIDTVIFNDREDAMMYIHEIQMIAPHAICSIEF